MIITLSSSFSAPNPCADMGCSQLCLLAADTNVTDDIIAVGAKCGCAEVGWY